MLNNIEIRRIALAEYALVTDLFNSYRIFYKKKSDKVLAEGFIKERLAKKESVIFVALNQEGPGRVPVGFVQLYPGYSSLEASTYLILNDLYVCQDYRSCGIASGLIRAAMHHARLVRCGFIQIETYRENFIARTLYEKIGFVRQIPDLDCLQYKLPLGPC